MGTLAEVWVWAQQGSLVNLQSVRAVCARGTLVQAAWIAALNDHAHVLQWLLQYLHVDDWRRHAPAPAPAPPTRLDHVLWPHRFRAGPEPGPGLGPDTGPDTGPGPRPGAGRPRVMPVTIGPRSSRTHFASSAVRVRAVQRDAVEKSTLLYAAVAAGSLAAACVLVNAKATLSRGALLRFGGRVTPLQLAERQAHAQLVALLTLQPPAAPGTGAPGTGAAAPGTAAPGVTGVPGALGNAPAVVDNAPAVVGNVRAVIDDVLAAIGDARLAVLHNFRIDLGWY